MEYRVNEVLIKGEKVTLKLEEKNKEQELEILLKTYIEIPISTGQIIEEKKYKELLEINTKFLVLDEAYKHLKMSDLTIAELTKKLGKKYANKKKIINEVIKELKDKNYLNDERYILNYIRKSLTSFKGLERIKYELIYKGIDEQDIYSFIDEDLLDIEKEKAYSLGSKQMRLSKNLEFKKMRDKVYYKLSYAGYSKELIEEIMFKLNLIKEI